MELKSLYCAGEQMQSRDQEKAQPSFAPWCDYRYGTLQPKSSELGKTRDLET